VTTNKITGELGTPQQLVHCTVGWSKKHELQGTISPQP